MQMIYLPVHCCCDPEKRLGWLSVPDDGRVSRIAFWVKGRKRQFVVTVEKLGKTTIEPGDSIDIATNVQFQAVKSGHRSLAYWRRLPGFVETLPPGATVEKPIVRKYARTDDDPTRPL